MRIAMIFMLFCGSTFGQEARVAGSQKPGFIDLYHSDTPQISVEVRFVTGPREVFQELKTADLIRTAVQKPQRVLPASSDEILKQQGGIQLVSATTVIKNNEPVFIRTLSETQVKRVINTVQNHAEANVLFAPKVVMFDKQEAEIQDTTSRPFVVGLTKMGNAHQPEIEPISEGSRLGIRSTVKGQDVRLDLAIDVSQIQSVAIKHAGPTDTAVQVPSTRTTAIQLSALVAQGQTLAISGFGKNQEVRVEQPVLKRIPYVSRMFKNTAVGSEYQEMMILITPRILSKEETRQ